MSEVKPLQPSDQVTFYRDATVTQIPSGEPLTLPKGTHGLVTQTLGGHITLQIPSHGVLARVADKDLDALYPEGTSITKNDEAEKAHDPNAKLEKEAIWEALKTCFDPEIPLNIVDLGLIYDMQVQPLDQGGNEVDVKMTLTAQGCGMGAAIAGDAETKISRLPGVAKARVEVVWDPPWNSSMISAGGKKILGIEED